MLCLGLPEGSSAIEQDVQLNKEWKEGPDCNKVEPTVICHDGESIQVFLNIFSPLTKKDRGNLSIYN